MPLAGHHLLPREIAQLGAPHWHDAELVKMVATCLSESAGYVGAWHDNLAAGAHEGDWRILSRDCGLMQVNVAAREIGGDIEKILRTEAPAEAVWRPVAIANVAAGYRLYEQSWPREGGPSPAIRRWQPWVAYTTGWATFPEFWIWHQVEGKPVGPWTAPGRYLQQAICGVANHHLWIKKDMTLAQATKLAVAHAAHFGVRASIAIRRGFISFETPTRPKIPPDDGIGPRPVPNSGL